MQENLNFYSADYILDFYQQHGYHVVKTESCWWVNYYRQKYVYFAFPAHQQVVPTKAEVNELFNRLPSAIALRFIGPTHGDGKPSFIWVCRKPYNLNVIQKKSRNQTRRGLEKCSVRLLTFSQLICIGWEAHSDTLNRHGQKAQSLGLNDILDDCNAYKAWGAFIEDSLAAYVVVLLVDDWAHIIINRSTTSSLKHYPNNALVFQVVSELLSQKYINVVSYGWDSLVPNQGLEKFKLGMGFVKEPVKQRIIIRPKFSLLINKYLCKLFIKVVPRKHLHYRGQQIFGLCQILAAS